MIATQNRGFVSQEGGGKPPLACDTKPEVRIMQILYVRIHGFVSQVGGVMPPPCRDTKPPFCVGCRGDGPTPPQDKIWTSMALQHELPPKK